MWATLTATLAASRTLRDLTISSGDIVPIPVYIYICIHLTHWGRDEVDAISQTTFSNEISLKFVFSVRINNIKHWFRQWLGAYQAASYYLNLWWLDYRRIYASLGLNGSKPRVDTLWRIAILIVFWLNIVEAWKDLVSCRLKFWKRLGAVQYGLSFRNPILDPKLVYP